VVRVFTPGLSVVYGVGDDELERTSMTNTYSTEHEQGGGHPEQHGGKPGRGGDKSFKVTVRTMAGHSRKGTVKPSDTVAEVTERRRRRGQE